MTTPLCGGDTGIFGALLPAGGLVHTGDRELGRESGGKCALSAPGLSTFLHLGGLDRALSAGFDRDAEVEAVPWEQST